MKTITLLFLFTFSILQVSYAQQLNWHHLGGPMGGTVGDMKIDSKGNIYAGLYTNIFTGQTYEGIYKSTDNGDTWQKLETVDQFEVYALYINRYDHIYAGTNYRDQVYRSTDEGLTWQIINNGYNTSECWAIGENKDGTTMFAGDGQFAQLYRTTNYGGNWTQVANLPVLSFATDSLNNIYCGTHGGLYKSTDDGLTWNPIGTFNTAVNPILIDENNGVICGTGYYDNGQGVFYSTDFGATWENIGLPNEIIYSLAFTKHNSLLAGTVFNGVFETTDMGNTWIQHNNGLFNKEVFRLAVNDNDDIFVASEVEGIFRSTDRGELFKQVGIPVSGISNLDFIGDSLIVTATVSGVQTYNRNTGEWKNIGQHAINAVETDKDGTILAASSGGGLFQTTDLGESWNNIFTEPYILNVKKTASNTILAASTNGLFRSTDGGSNWSSTGVSAGVENCAIEINSNGDIWAVGFQKIYKSTNDGLTFTPTTLDFRYVDRNNLFVKDSILFLGDYLSGKGYHYSTDYGITWINGYHHRGLKCVSGNKNLIIGGTFTDIIYTENLDVHLDSLAFPEEFYGLVSEIEFDDKGDLFFGTTSQGLYEMDIILSVDEEPVLPDKIYLSQNYPNPFNPITKIKFTIPSVIANEVTQSLVTLKVYDVLGIEVTTLVNEYKPAGSYEVEFNANSHSREGGNLSSGIYFYKLQAGDYVETKKMLLVK